MLLLCVIYLLTLFQLVWCFPSSIEAPSQDDFYNNPAGFESASLGTILKHRNTPGPLRYSFIDINVKNSWQLLVRSEDSFGKPISIVTTVIEPYNSTSSKVVSYQAIQDSASSDCSPSYVLLNGPNTLFQSPTDITSIHLALSQGYFVVSPDYEGSSASFTVGTQSGKTTLDSVRAALNSKNITGIDSNADTVMWGYSGGAIPTSWAAAFHPTYAPDLTPNLKGAAFGGWVNNVTASAKSMDKSVYAGLAAAAIAGISNQYPKFYDIIQQELYPEKHDDFMRVYDNCLTNTLIQFMFSSFFTGDSRYFKSGMGLFNDPVVEDILQENTLGVNETLTPEIPLFLYHGHLDTIVPIESCERVFNDWCDLGVKSFEFAADLTAGHVTETSQGAGAALAWMKKILNGEAPIDGCKKTDRLSNLLYPGVDQSVNDLFRASYNTVFGLDVGPDASKLGPNGENITASMLHNIEN